jgi:hypothetical protein
VLSVPGLGGRCLVQYMPWLGGCSPLGREAAPPARCHAMLSIRPAGFSDQLIFGQFPRKIEDSAWDAYTAKETENRQREVDLLRYSPYGPLLLDCQHEKPKGEKKRKRVRACPAFYSRPLLGPKPPFSRLRQVGRGRGVIRAGRAAH